MADAIMFADVVKFTVFPFKVVSYAENGRTAGPARNVL